MGTCSTKIPGCITYKAAIITPSGVDSSMPTVTPVPAKAPSVITCSPTAVTILSAEPTTAVNGGILPLIGGLTSLGATLLTGGTFGEACVSAFFGATSGALTAALPSAGFVIDVVLGLAEEIAINAMKPEDDSEIDTAEDNTMIDTVVSVGVDSISSLTSEESRLTKEVMQEFVDAIPRISKGNHPKVKSSAQKVINRTSKLIGQELGETISEKTVSSVFKKILQAIF